jgi:nucleotide-binding universal stress UspA family protein
MKALSVLVLRYKQPEGRGWRVPLNFHIRGKEVPVGLGLIALTLILLALINLVTKKTATIAGFSFSIALFILFELSEKYNRKRHAERAQGMEQFRLDTHDDLTRESLHVRPGNVLVAVRNPNRLEHLERILHKTDTRKIDIVVLSIRDVTSAGSGEHTLEAGQIFAGAETGLFTKVVALAEKAGKHVELLTVPGARPYEAIVQTAQRLESARIVMGLSPKLSPAEQGRAVGQAWEQLPQPRPTLSLEMVSPGQEESLFFNLGPHPPRLWPEDVDLVHRLWLELSQGDLGASIHHRDVVGVALRRLEEQLHSEGHRDEVLAEVSEEIHREHTLPIPRR